MLFGHDQKIDIFKKLTASGNLSHAYLFYGEPEIGKFTFARSLAHFLEYGGPFDTAQGRPLIDYQEVLPDPEKRSIGIDAVRQVKNFLFQKPFKSERRLVVIDQAQTLTDEAQGALLKIVEEPPATALVIVIASEPTVLLPPLLSRLIKVYFSKLPKEEVERILVRDYKITPAKAAAAARRSFGRLGRARKNLEKATVVPNGENESLENDLSQKTLTLYLEDKVKNAALIGWLLQREWAANAYNLNPHLQRKAVELKLNG